APYLDVLATSWDNVLIQHAEQFSYHPGQHHTILCKVHDLYTEPATCARGRPGGCSSSPPQDVFFALLQLILYTGLQAPDCLHTARRRVDHRGRDGRGGTGAGQWPVLCRGGYRPPPQP